MKTTHLQGIGQHKAKRADALAVGDVAVWNFGCTSPVVRVARASACFLSVTFASNGAEHTRRFKNDRLIAVA